jgi:hypothetical protein
LLSQREHQPELDILADVTTSWTTEAEKRMERVPDFVKNIARMAILRYAQERGHTVITESIVEEATAQLMPGRAEQVMEEIVDAYDQQHPDKAVLTDAPMQWTTEASALLNSITDKSLRDNLKMRAEKMMTRLKKNQVAKVKKICIGMQQRSPGLCVHRKDLCGICQKPVLRNMQVNIIWSKSHLK